MNTYANTIHRITRNNRSRNIALMTIVLALVAVAALAIYMTNRSVVAASNTAVAYSNALEMQYAQPWLVAHNKPVIAYGNALEMQYAQPWLQKTKQSIAVTGSEISLDCQSSLEMLYACKYGYGQP